MSCSMGGITAFKEAAQVVLDSGDLVGKFYRYPRPCGLCNALGAVGGYSIIPELFGPISYSNEDMQEGMWTDTRVTLLMLICELSAEELLELANSPA